MQWHQHVWGFALIWELLRGNVFCIIGDLDQWRTQDFPEEGHQLPKVGVLTYNFAEKCMKMKEFGTPGGHASLAPLPPPPGSATVDFC